MLEAKNLRKEYTTKNGPVVKALDDVSVKFEETGMVFILGKSGSGKSTLLNVLGGLDQYDSGEVIVKGKSSKDFKQADFDSYRNTFIGFIFQDYNILEEFTISKNIGLALELQGKKADKQAIEDLMEQVDLKGFGNRKPNTLSGGQKQRVAIARALVKNPEIIMADEPTGALDSNTGKQVFDTLKKLSKTKLVLIVSHDREFAEHYGDRIIELADGKIISDIVKYKSAPKSSNGLDIVDDKIMTIKKGTVIDKDKVQALQDFINNSNEDVIISIDNKSNTEFKKIARIDDDGNKESFKDTDQLDIKEYDGSQLHLIRSKLPAKDSVKMGASGLKAKPVRLFFTIILSAIAFGLFGLADTLSSYDKVDNTIISIKDSKIDYAAISKGIKSDPSYSWADEVKLSQDDFDEINNSIESLNFYPVFSVYENLYNDMEFDSFIYEDDGIGNSSYYVDTLYGLVELYDGNINEFGSIIEGRLATGDNEIVITKYTYDIFEKGDYYDSENNLKIEIDSTDDILNKTLKFDEYSFKIVGVLDTDCDLSRYDRMLDDNFGHTMADNMLKQEFEGFISYSHHSLGYVSEGFYNRNFAKDNLFGQNKDGFSITFNNSMPANNDQSQYAEFLADYNSSLKDSIYWLNGEKDELTGNEVVLSYNFVNQIEFTIDNQKITYDDLENKYYLHDSFVTDFNNLLNEIGLSNYADAFSQLLDYYNAINTDSYQYNPFKEAWSGYIGELGLEYLTSGQKNSIHEFISTYTPDHYVNPYEFLYQSNIKTMIETRLDSLNNVITLDEYVDNLISYFFYEYWYPDFAISDTEIQIFNKFKISRLDRIKEHIPTKAWLSYYSSATDKSYYEIPRETTVVGIYLEHVNENDNYQSGIIAPFLAKEYKDSIGGIYNFMVASLDYDDTDSIEEVVKYTYKNRGKLVYELNNSVMDSIANVNSMIETLASVFLYVGLAFALFAALLLLNFITISISYKKREIGVLRAIGARSMDVFKIFFSEAFIIAFINFIVSSIICVVTCSFINSAIREEMNLLITILNVGPRQIILMLGVSTLVAFISSFFPVKNIARKKPIDAIRNA